MPKNETNATFLVKFLKLTRKLRLKCYYNDVIMVLYPVLLHVQNCFIHKIIAILRQIN